MRSSTSLLFVILAGLSTLDAVAQSPGTFVATGAMTTPRMGHTATLLKDGRVLITGGIHRHGQDTILASAELYDSSAGTFTPTGDMTTPREWHTATLLPDGRVLIVGGVSELIPGIRPSPLSSSELYDPATGLFTRSGDMTTPHRSHAANLLNNGKVLITGSPTAELYDPTSGIFTSLGELGNTSDTLVLKDGKVIITDWSGGVFLYEVGVDSLKLLATLPTTGISGRTTTLLANGKVLVSGGGIGYDGTVNDAALYDPRRETLEGTGLLLFSRVGHTATLLPGGHVLIVGGYNGDSYDSDIPVLTVGEDYDPSTGSFTSAGSVVLLRQAHTATLLPDGRVLIAGGVDRGNQSIATTELYIPPLRAVSAASMSGPLAPESLGSLFGSRLALATANADPLSPPTILGGISLRIVDSSGAASLAPLLYVSPSQINFEVPAGTPPGDVSLEVVNAPSQLSAVQAQVKTIAPGLFAFEDNTAAAYALRIELDGTQTVLSVRNPIVLDDRPVYLVLYATGIRNRSSLENVRCTIGGISMPVEYAGPNGSGMPGLDQVNVRLTSDLKDLNVTKLVLTVDGVPSNSVSADIR
jgi:uncharacterized protein (TIGR03437 family)